MKLSVVIYLHIIKLDKLKELVPEFISNNSIFGRLDPSLQNKILDMTEGGVEISKAR